VWGLPLAVAGLEVGHGDDVIIVGSEAPEQGLQDYRVRGSPETLLACLKLWWQKPLVDEPSL
jgi:hypothetical protein